MEKVLKYLDAKNISYKLHTHEAVFTVEEAEKYCSHIPGMHCKNLFMRDHKGKRHYLLILPNNKPIDLKIFSALLNDRLSFASAKRMMKYLGVEPGSVSVFGLINDLNSEIIVYIDKDVHDAEQVTFHPNDNKATLVLERNMFHTYLESLKNDVTIMTF